MKHQRFAVRAPARFVIAEHIVRVVHGLVRIPVQHEDVALRIHRGFEGDLLPRGAP